MDANRLRAIARTAAEVNFIADFSARSDQAGLLIRAEDQSLHP